MTGPVFGSAYAGEYDVLYGDKDYEAECDLLERVFERHGAAPIRRVLDLGCGTGSHALGLARRGYWVTGVDRSAAMLAQAELKAEAAVLPAACRAPVFLAGDTRALDLGEPFDAVLMMFAVLGYHLTNDDVLAALRSVRRHLRPGGLFVGDVWYGPAVLAIRPSDRVKIVPTADGQVVRVASSAMDPYHHAADVHYRVWRTSGRQVVSESEERHRIRYFFPQELALFLSSAGLELVGLFSPACLDQPAAEDGWTALAVGRAR